MISNVMGVKNIRSNWRKAITDITFPIIAKLTNCETIIADYDSTDDTVGYIKSFGFKCLHTKPNKGQPLNVAKALNHAISKSKSEYIHPISPDIIYSNNICDILGKNFPKNPNGVVKYNLYQIVLSDYNIRLRGGEKFGVNGYMYCWKKSKIYKIKGYDERLTCHREDYDFMHRYFKFLKPVAKHVIEGICTLHIKHPRSWGLMKYPDSLRRFTRKTYKANFANGRKNVVNSYF